MRAEQILPDAVNEATIHGVNVRKGTVAAFLANAQVLGDANTTDAQREQARADIVDSLPALRALGLFEVFELRDASLREWIAAH